MPEEPEKPTDFINDPDLSVTGTFTYEDTTLRMPSPEEMMPCANLKIKLLHPAAIVPKQGSPHSAGYDLFCVEDFVIGRQQTLLIPLGFATEMPIQIHGRIESRSGFATNCLVVLTGVIDPDYRGEWKVILRNVSPYAEQRILKGTKIAQVVFRPTYRASWTESAELEDSDRGTGGFGSTGQ